MRLYMLTARWLIDSCLAVWFFSRVPGSGRKLSFDRTALSVLCMAAILPIYIFIDYLPWNTARFVYRAVLCAAYLRLVKELDWRRCLYFSLLYWLIFNICTNCFSTLALRDYFFVGSPSEISWITGLCYLGYFLVITFFARSIPFDEIREPGWGRYVFALFLCAAQLYIKSTLRYISVGPAEMSAYLILLQALLGAALLFFERYLYQQKTREAERMESLSNSYRYKSALAQHEAIESVRRLHHDMKNHLLALQALTGSDERMSSYLSGLMEELGQYDHVTRTGSELLDGVLADKMRMCVKNSIDFIVDLDFRPCAYMEDLDVIVIFGNILDNAIEAAAKVADPQDRSILLKGRQEANEYILTCSNFFEGTLDLADGLPRTSKADKTSHGIGLRSVKNSVEKYGGVLSMRAEGQRLILSILLPLEREEK